MTAAPAPGDGPLAVILTRLDEIVRRLNKIDEDHDDYVLQQTYDVQQKATEEKIAALRDGIKELWEARTEDQSWRKTTNVTVLIAVASNLITIVLGVIGFLLMKG